MKLLEDIEFSNRKVFLRADLDVPLDDPKNLSTNTRLQFLKPTVDYIFDHGAAKIIIGGHIGRPEGRDEKLSTKHLKLPLEDILARSVIYNPSMEGEVPENLVLLENLRFFEGETKADLEFAKKLAKLADIYVNEAFGNCHRNHASMSVLPSLLPHAAGLHLAQEVEGLKKLVVAPQRPFVAIVGGAKLETKVPVITNLSKLADIVLVGGELPSEIERENMKFEKNVIVAKLNKGGDDISDESIELFCNEIKNADSVVWNGPMGLFEKGQIKGTEEIAKAILERGTFSVVGGGETCDVLGKLGILSKFSFVSSGGGAMLEYLSGKELPGLTALE